MTIQTTLPIAGTTVLVDWAGDVIADLTDHETRIGDAESDISFIQPAFARMTSDQGFVNAVLADVTELLLPVAANRVYNLMARLIAGGDDVNGLATSWSYPALATLADGQMSVQDTAAGAASTAGSLDARGLAAAASPSISLFHRTPDTNFVIVRLEGTLITGANSGTLQLRASKHVNTSGTNTTLKAGSIIRLERMQ